MDPERTPPIPLTARLSTEERIARGRAARKRIGWQAIAALPTADRDPLGILAEQNRSRSPSLVPLRIERMSADPFAFFRGTAALMAADHARSPHSGILVGSCGDAHVSNFGFYASPQRTLVFDLDDFDEAAWAPWEWDLKRLVTSIVVAGQSTSREEEVTLRAARDTIAAYLRSLRKGLGKSPLERYFTHFDARQRAHRMDRRSRDVVDAALEDAAKRTGTRAARRLTGTDAEGRRRFVERPPVMAPIGGDTAAHVEGAVDQYLRSAGQDVRLLMAQYGLADVAQRVVGVGSVGTRCYLALFEDGDGRPLILQVKEAGQSVLVQHGGIVQPSAVQERIDARGEGARVVGMQRILQSLSDPFLGHLVEDSRGYYVRQFHDMKGGVEVELLEDAPFLTYASACAITLARAHGQSPNIAAVVGYIGKNDEVARAVADWSLAYADVSEQDYQAFVTAR
jgi:uncharacterized protein (DUF2252 family)